MKSQPIESAGHDAGHYLRPQFVAARRWEMHVGTGKLYIIGVNHGDWFPVTEFSSKPGQVGTDEERRIIRNAVRILNIERKHQDGLTREMVDDAMQRAALTKGELEDEPEEVEPEPPPVINHQRLMIGEWEKRWIRVGKGYVHRVTKFEAANAAERNAYELERGEIRYATAEDNKAMFWRSRNKKEVAA